MLVRRPWLVPGSRFRLAVLVVGRRLLLRGLLGGLGQHPVRAWLGCGVRGVGGRVIILYRLLFERGSPCLDRLPAPYQKCASGVSWGLELYGFERRFVGEFGANQQLVELAVVHRYADSS